MVSSLAALLLLSATNTHPNTHTNQHKRRHTHTHYTNTHTHTHTLSPNRGRSGSATVGQSHTCVCVCVCVWVCAGEGLAPVELLSSTLSAVCLCFRATAGPEWYTGLQRCIAVAAHQTHTHTHTNMCAHVQTSKTQRYTCTQKINVHTHTQNPHTVNHPNTYKKKKNSLTCFCNTHDHGTYIQNTPLIIHTHCMLHAHIEKHIHYLNTGGVRMSNKSKTDYPWRTEHLHPHHNSITSQSRGGPSHDTQVQLHWTAFVQQQGQ